MKRYAILSVATIVIVSVFAALSNYYDVFANESTEIETEKDEPYTLETAEEQIHTQEYMGLLFKESDASALKDYFEAPEEGILGEDISYRYDEDENVIYFSGDGKMPDYEYLNEFPYFRFMKNIDHVVINGKITCRLWNFKYDLAKRLEKILSDEEFLKVLINRGIVKPINTISDGGIILEDTMDESEFEEFSEEEESNAETSEASENDPYYDENGDLIVPIGIESEENESIDDSEIETAEEKKTTETDTEDETIETEEEESQDE